MNLQTQLKEYSKCFIPIEHWCLTIKPGLNLIWLANLEPLIGLDQGSNK